MTDFAHQPQHLLSVQPAGDAHERLFVVRAASVLFTGPGRAGSALADGIAKVPALAGMFFHRKTFLDVERKGERNRGGEEEPLLQKGASSPPRPPTPSIS